MWFDDVAAAERIVLPSTVARVFFTFVFVDVD